jgi:hypothetical protein
MVVVTSYQDDPVINKKLVVKTKFGHSEWTHELNMYSKPNIEKDLDRFLEMVLNDYNFDEFKSKINFKEPIKSTMEEFYHETYKLDKDEDMKVIRNGEPDFVIDFEKTMFGRMLR